jgi:nitrile hydratase
MPRAHDQGGRPGTGPIDRSEHQAADWELLADGMTNALYARGIRNLDEHRRAREDMPPELYPDITYYERWIYGIEAILIEKGYLTKDEIDRKTADIEARWGEP